MADAYRCPNCGAELPPGDPHGPCPRCRTLSSAGGLPPTLDDDATTAGAKAPAGGEATEPARDAAPDYPFVPAPESTGAASDRPGDPDALTAAGGEDAAPTLPRGTTVWYFGDYEILNELGRGGMGVVYAARQVSLNRPVALKMVKAGLLADGDELRRFRNEAEAAALLDHHAIVPVYEVGDHAGQHYFSMKLVPGGSLVPLLDRYKRDPRAAALLTSEIAEAVQHAHMRGILHRDLKPANILIDAEGHPHITDFGLAKRVEGDSDLTASGAILGTPSYMAPEQATGHRGSITTATDVYGTGTVLYALLTGRAPFGGDSAIATIDAVRDRAPEPPRRINLAVPRDLETICLKCLEKDPRRRYSAAQALADDLRAWLDNRPIAARRVGPAERAWLLCRRRPAVAALSAAVLLALLGGAAATIAVQAAANRALGRKNADLTEALGREAQANIALAAANQRVEERYNVAVDAIKTFHTGVSEDFLLKQDQFKDLRDRLLKSAADFYGKLGGLLGKESDAASRRALYQANFELADLTEMVGRDDDALEAHRAVLAARGAIAAGPGADVGSRTDWLRSQIRVASLLERAGKTAEALAAYREAETLLAALDPPSPEARAVLADCRSRLGWLLSRTGKNADALLAYRRARADQERLAAESGAASDVRRNLAVTINRIGLLLQHTGKPSEAESELRQALALREKQVHDKPGSAGDKSSQAESHFNLGSLLSDTGRTVEGEAELRKALAIQQELADKNPAVADFQARVADSRNNLAFRLFRAGKPAESEDELRKAVVIRRKLVDDHPAVTDFRNRLAVCHNNLGNVLWGTNRPAQAEAEYRRAIAIQQELVDQNPTLTDFRSRLAGSHNNLANLLTTTGKRAESEAEYRKAIALFRTLAARNPTMTAFRSSLALGHSNLGLLFSEISRPAEATAEYRESQRILQELADKNPAVTEFRSRLASSHDNLANLLSVAGELATAEAEFRRALRLEHELVDKNPGDAQYRYRLVVSLTGLGEVLRQTGRPAEAETENRKAVKIGRELSDANPKVPDFRDSLAAGYVGVGDAVSSLGKSGEARDAYDRAIAIRESLVVDSPDSPRYRIRLAESLRRRGLLRRDAGDLKGAAADTRGALAVCESISMRSGEDWFGAASCHAMLAGLAGRDGSGVSAGEAAVEADRAMALLREAVARSFHNFRGLIAETSFDPLRTRDDFRLLVMDVAMPAEPFTRTR